MKWRLSKVIQNEYVFSVVSRGITIVMSLLQSILIARYLGPALQGDMAFVTSVSSIGAIILTFGFHQAYPYLRKEYGKDSIFKSYISTIFLHFIVGGVICIVLAILLCHNLSYLGAFLLIPFQGFANVVGYVCLVENPNERNKWWVITAAFDILFILLMRLLTTANWCVAFLIFLFPEFIRTIVFTLLLRVRAYKNSKEYKFMYASLLKFGFFPMLALLMTTLNYKIDVLMLQQFENITAADIGVYSIGMAIADRIVLIPDTLKGVLVSRLSKDGDESEVAKVCRISFWANIAVCIIVLLCGQWVVSLLYGTEYRKSYTVILICSFGTIFIGYFKLIAQYNIVNKKQIRNVILLSLSILINIILNYILIPRYGLNGAAFASGVGYFLSGIIFVIWFSRSTGLSFNLMFMPQVEDIRWIQGFFKRGS